MPTVAPYYKSIVEEVKRYSQNRHPVSFIGMFDCGKDYVFNLIAQEKAQKNSPLLIPIDLTNTKGSLKKIINACYYGFAKVLASAEKMENLSQIWKNLNQISQTDQVTLCFDFGDDAAINLEFLASLYSWGNLLADKFNWIIFANYNILNLPQSRETVFEKIIKSNIIPVLPTDNLNSQVVYKNYEEYFGKNKNNSAKKIIELSGGNPGLLKSLFLLGLKNKLEDWENDSQVIMRLDKILSGLNQRELEILASVQNRNSLNYKNQEYINLKRFGFINEKGQLFSPILGKYLKTYFDNTGVKLSTMQQKIFVLLRDKSPQLVTRDEIAKVMWGARWLKKYSDWAMDQIVYAIRNKLSALNSNWKLETKRGIGYFLSKKNE